MVRCKERTISDRSNTGIVVSNATGAIEEYRQTSVLVLSCVGSGITVDDKSFRQSCLLYEKNLQFQKLILVLKTPQNRCKTYDVSLSKNINDN
jgi:hypothetical protein